MAEKLSPLFVFDLQIWSKALQVPVSKTVLLVLLYSVLEQRGGWGSLFCSPALSLDGPSHY
jgi:hypothetical protein